MPNCQYLLGKSTIFSTRLFSAALLFASAISLLRRNLLSKYTVTLAIVFISWFNLKTKSCFVFLHIITKKTNSIVFQKLERVKRLVWMTWINTSSHFLSQKSPPSDNAENPMRAIPMLVKTRALAWVSQECDAIPWTTSIMESLFAQSRLAFKRLKWEWRKGSSLKPMLVENSVAKTCIQSRSKDIKLFWLPGEGLTIWFINLCRIFEKTVLTIKWNFLSFCLNYIKSNLAHLFYMKLIFSTVVYKYRT